jgi:flagellar basal-body rod modification protein FlgD
VGRSVSVETDSAALYEGDAVAALVEVPASTQDLTVDIFGPSGQLLDSIDVGSAPAGDLAFRWNGSHAEVNGKVLDWKSSHEAGLPAGNYKFAFTASIDGKATQLQSYLSANVNSVTVGANGALTLNLAGVGAVNLADVKQFNE